MLAPERMLEAHVNLIRHGRLVCHARRPECERCPVRLRCRFVDPKAP
jgi:Predicted EndoIII-related endonuclease